MRNAGLSIDVLSKYVKLMGEGPKTAKERKQLLEGQRDILLKRQKDINDTIDRINYKIKIYDDIVQGKREDFILEP